MTILYDNNPYDKRLKTAWGFHLDGMGKQKINGIIEDFQRLGLEKVAPCHCTGDLARELLKGAYRDNSLLAGVGGMLEAEG